MPDSVIDSLPVRFRPRNFGGIIGQKFAVSLINGALRKDKIPRSILIGGPTGCGKTTFARILASVINCQNRKGKKFCLSKKISKKKLCDSCKLSLMDNHPDVHELNMAYSRGIEDVRKIVDLASHVSMFNNRIFIIDEFQQVTPQGMQAILKPLEHPPARTVWILATMEPEKIPISVSDRCIYLPLEPVGKRDMAKVIKRVSNAEDIVLGDKVISWVTSMSSSRPRDALKILDSLIYIMADRDETELVEIPEDISEILSRSGIINTEPTALAILALLYSKNPLVYAFLQRGVTDQLVKDLYYLQDGFVAHLAYGNKSWKWKSVLKIVRKVLKDTVRSEAYSLPIKYHIALGALLGKAMINTRLFGDAGVALRQSISEWFMLDDGRDKEE